MEKTLLVVAVAALAACGTEGTDQAMPGAAGPVLVQSEPSPPDAACPTGATTVLAGNDINGNGRLEPDEATSRQQICNPQAAPILSTSTPTGPSAKCKDGGVVVRSGPDLDGNGRLDDEEVRSSTEVCGSGAGERLTKTSVVAKGDASCPFGGARTESGVDDGSGEGIAGNGILEAGEILVSSVTCSSGGAHARSTAPPGGEVGTASIRLGGGVGSAGVGGNGGLLQIHSSATEGGHIGLFRTGAITPTARPVVGPPDFGAHVLDVAADLTLAYRASPEEAANGEYYVLGVRLQFRKNDVEKAIVVTGLHVRPNVVLTLPARDTEIVLSGDLSNEGTIRTTPGANGYSPAMSFLPKRFFGSAGSRLDASGKPVTNANGGWGGNIAIYTDYIANEGVIDTRGADGGAGDWNGGAAGVVNVIANRAGAIGIANAGTIIARGGKGSGKGNGGRGSIVGIQTIGFLIQRGDIDTSGGNGASGGDAYFVGLQASGELRVTGTLTTRGGDALAASCTGSCQGGISGFVQLRSYGGETSFAGKWIGSGGASVGAAGRDGNAFKLESRDGETVAAGNITLAGSFEALGGAGTTGGKGGGVWITQFTAKPAGQGIAFFGLTNVDLGGGQGTTGGGNGGLLDVTNGAPSDTRSSGSVLVHVPVVARGGAATTSGAGGNGGTAQIFAGALGEPPADAQAIALAGALDVGGGSGIIAGGASGAINVSARDRIDVHAPIIAKGGDASGANGTGGAASAGKFETPGAFTIGAPLTLAGGSGTGAAATGGACAGLSLAGAQVTATAALACTGGNGTMAAGGNGGPLSITSKNPPSVTAGLSAAGGNGTPPGAPGVITIDGVPK